ncbi:MAG: hypothetical protein ACOYLQ_07340 [Hyphomicrobiaceae bacterium]|jgi:hypothetical protein
MTPSGHEANAIRLQLVELSEHILRRLSVVLARARAESRAAYEDVEATARHINHAQTRLMDELGRRVPARDELPLLKTLMGVQDRTLGLLEQLEALPFNRSAPEPRYVEPQRLSHAAPRHDEPIAIEPWPEDAEWEAAPPEPAARPRPQPARPVQHPAQAHAPVSPGRAGVGRLQTHPSVGAELPVAVGQPVARMRPADPAPPRPRPAAAAAAVPLAASPPAPERRRPVEIEAEVVPVVDRKSGVPAPAVKPTRPRVPWTATLSRYAHDIAVMARTLPVAVLAAVFVGIGVVFMLFIGRSLLSVMDRAPEAVAASVISTDRLPPESDAAGAARSTIPATGDAYVVVLSMHPDAAGARKGFAEMRQRAPGALAGMSADIQPIESPAGLRYRLALAPALTRERAFTICGELKSAGFPACWLRRLQR